MTVTLRLAKASFLPEWAVLHGGAATFRDIGAPLGAVPEGLCFIRFLSFYDGESNIRPSVYYMTKKRKRAFIREPEFGSNGAEKDGSGSDKRT